MAVQLYGPPSNAICSLPERFERKYFVAPHNVGIACGLLRQLCLPAADYPSEQINSLYFDTPSLTQHEISDSGEYRKDKVRIRWYGSEDAVQGMRTVFIELKSRQGFAGTKQRARLRVPAESLSHSNLKKGIVPRALLLETLARFGYFAPDILLPIVAVSYWRYRFRELTTAQRISLDCHIRSTMIFPGLGNGEEGLELSGGVVEMKGRSMELPPALRHVRILDTDWTRFSKYSACIDSHVELPGTVGRLSPSGRVVRHQSHG